MLNFPFSTVFLSKILTPKILFNSKIHKGKNSQTHEKCALITQPKSCSINSRTTLYLSYHINKGIRHRTGCVRLNKIELLNFTMLEFHFMNFIKRMASAADALFNFNIPFVIILMDISYIKL